MTLLVEIYLPTWVITFWINWTFWILPNWFALMPVRLFRLNIARFYVDITFIIKSRSVSYQPMPIPNWFLNFRTRLKFTWIVCFGLFNSHVDTIFLSLYLLRFSVIIIYRRLIRSQISRLKINTFLLNCLTLEHTRSSGFLFLHNRLGHHSNRLLPSQLDCDYFLLLFLLVILILILLTKQFFFIFVFNLWMSISISIVCLIVSWRFFFLSIHVLTLVHTVEIFVELRVLFKNWSKLFGFQLSFVC